MKKVWVVLCRRVYISDDYDADRKVFRPDDELKMLAAVTIAREINRDLGYFHSVDVEKIEDVK